MRVIVVVFCFIALAQCYPTDIVSFLKFLSPVISRLDIWFSNAEKSCPEPYKNDTNNAHLELQNCLISAPVHTDNICIETQKTLERCLTPLVDTVSEKCLPENSKDLPQILLKATLSANKYVCELEDKNSEFTQDCINDDKEQCYNDLEDNADKSGSDLPTKSDFCKYGADAKSCFQQLLKESCQDNIINFVNDVFSEC